jgi:hypothetical protein
MPSAGRSHLDELIDRARPVLDRTARRAIHGARAALDRAEARDGDTVEITPRGRHEVQYWGATFRARSAGA